jgi:hypothetical protein
MKGLFCNKCKSYVASHEHECMPVPGVKDITFKVADVAQPGPDPSYVGIYGSAGRIDDIPKPGPVYVDDAPVPNVEASELLRRAARIIDDRQTLRDQGSERSMTKTVSAFNALTGSSLSVTDGWVFMAILKLARSQHGSDIDNFIDGAAYMALAGESTVPNPEGDKS